MPVDSQFNDKARVYRKTKQLVRNADGGYNEDEWIGPWFRCFYDIGGESEERGQAGIRRRRSGATIYAAVRATDGTLVDLKPEDSLEIDSPGHGQLKLDITARPEKVTKGRVVYCWIASVGKTNRQGQ